MGRLIVPRTLFLVLSANVNFTPKFGCIYHRIPLSSILTILFQFSTTYKLTASSTVSEFGSPSTSMGLAFLTVVNLNLPLAECFEMAKRSTSNDSNLKGRKKQGLFDQAYIASERLTSALK